MLPSRRILDLLPFIAPMPEILKAMPERLLRIPRKVASDSPQGDAQRFDENLASAKNVERIIGNHPQALICHFKHTIKNK